MRCDEGDDTLPPSKEADHHYHSPLAAPFFYREQQLLCIILGIVIVIVVIKRTMIPKFDQKKLLLYHYFRTGNFCRIMTLAAVTKIITVIENKIRGNGIKGMTTKQLLALFKFPLKTDRGVVLVPKELVPFTQLVKVRGGNLVWALPSIRFS